MSYLYCHNCGWSQDDFWSDSYNPITFLEKNYKKDLLEEPLDKIVGTKEIRYKNGCETYNEKITNRDLIIEEMLCLIENIKEMKYRTFEEFKEKNPNQKCPYCGQKTLGVD